MALGDLWQIRAVGTLLGQEINNIFWYIQTTSGGTGQAADAAAGMWLQKISPAVKAVQHQDFVWTTMVATNWSTGLEQAEYPVTSGGAGTVTVGDCMPSFNAWGFTYRKSVPLYSSGGKRIAGVPEAWNSGNSFVGDAGLMDEVVDSLGNGLINGSFVGKPVVLVTQLGGVPYPTGMGVGGFTTWDIDVVIFRGCTTQRSRKA